MNENREGVQQPLHYHLQLFWIFALATVVLSLFENAVISLIALAVSIGQLYQIYCMRTVSAGMAKAFRTKVAALALMAGGLVFGLLGLGSVLGVLMALVILAGAVISIVADYYLYAGLNGVAAERGYDYPAGRILWCFWLSLIGAVAGGVLDAVAGETIPNIDGICGFAAQAISLILLWQYVQAVKRKEEIQ